MGEEPMSRRGVGAPHTQDVGPGTPGGSQHLTQGFTSSCPVTVNMVERPKGVHTAGRGEDERGDPASYPSLHPQNGYG